MLPLGLKLNDFTQVKRLIFNRLPFDINEELFRDNIIFGINEGQKKHSLKKNPKTRTTKKSRV